MIPKTFFRIIMIILVILTVATPAFGINEVAVTTQSGTEKFAFWAFILGGLSAFSLVTGALLGILWRPKPKLIASFTAFGAGALLAALSVELIAPTVMEFSGQLGDKLYNTKGHKESAEFIFLIAGCIAGGILFYSLNEALNSSGGYLRKVSTTITHFNHQKNKQFRRGLEHLSRIKLFKHIPVSHLDILVHHVRPGKIKAGRPLFNTGDKLNSLFVIENGEVETYQNGNFMKLLGAGSFLGETAFLTHEPVSYGAIAKTNLRIFEITKADFNAIHDSCPELQAILESESKHELMQENFTHTADTEYSQAAETWVDEASRHLHGNVYIPTQSEINHDAAKKDSAPLSIWLGIFLDGIPESFVIGSGFLLILLSKLSPGTVTFSEVVPYTLIAGLFLSNFPEALSSSIGMKKMGWKPLKILLLWTSLMLMTATGAAFGYFYGPKIPNYIEIGIEGIASGAMLTMIAQTMIPEAVHIGGSRVTGLSTLAGFLSAVAFKIFE
jgi:CRP-like cAMP-binding protein